LDAAVEVSVMDEEASGVDEEGSEALVDSAEAVSVKKSTYTLYFVNEKKIWKEI
jgi:hypothetical protein